MRGKQTRIARRRALVACFAVLLALVASWPATADNDDRARPGSPNQPTGIVRYPCVHPSFTKSGATPNGVCGYKFGVSGGGSYVLHPMKPADLDIYFYDARGEGIDSNAGSPTQCGNLSGDSIPQDAVTAIVVTTPSSCGSFEGSQLDVAFKYSG